MKPNLSKFAEDLAKNWFSDQIYDRYPKKLPYTLNEVVSEIYDQKLESLFIDNPEQVALADGLYLFEVLEVSKNKYQVIYRERGIPLEQKYFNNLRDAVAYKVEYMIYGSAKALLDSKYIKLPS